MYTLYHIPLFCIIFVKYLIKKKRLQTVKQLLSDVLCWAAFILKAKSWIPGHWKAARLMASTNWVKIVLKCVLKLFRLNNFEFKLV